MSNLGEYQNKENQLRKRRESYTKLSSEKKESSQKWNLDNVKFVC